MSGLRSARKAPGAKASGPGSTHTHTAKPREGAGAKASGGPFGHSTHEQLSPDRRSAPGAKASRPGRNTLVAPDNAFHHGTERVTEHHRK